VLIKPQMYFRDRGYKSRDLRSWNLGSSFRKPEKRYSKSAGVCMKHTERASSSATLRLAGSRGMGGATARVASEPLGRLHP